MDWYDIPNPGDPELDRLAERYRLHPLHIEDCRNRNQAAKIEEETETGYLFVVLKTVELTGDGTLVLGDLDLFLGRDYLITVQEARCQPVRALLDDMHAKLDGMAKKGEHLRADQLFYRIVDAVVDSYFPVLDYFDDLTDRVETRVLEDPSPEALQTIFEGKRNLLVLRRILTNTRDVAAHLQRSESQLIGRDMWPFLRDIYDHVARSLDTLEVQRDLLSGSMDIYLSSQAQRTNQVMKVLTVLGTIALPALVISGFYGMNLRGLFWAESPHGASIAAALMALTTVLLLVVLSFFKWL